MTRTFLIALIAALALAAPGQAQTSITLNANPIPIVNATINNQPVRLEVDLRMDQWMVLNGATADRLHVRRVPFAGVRMGVEGETSFLDGRMARPRIVFADGQVAHAFTGVFGVPVTTRADGVIGPGVFPHDVITVVLGAEPAGARDVTLPLERADHWRSHAAVGGLDLRLGFSLAHSETYIGVTAARQFDSQGLIVADGELVRREIILGLAARVQPVRTELSALGFALTPAFARTNEPLEGATEEEAIVVTSREPPPPSLTLGRAALAHCSSMSVDRRTRRMTLRCAP